jgi:putative hydrolase of the HAD superfamily
VSKSGVKKPPDKHTSPFSTGIIAADERKIEHMSVNAIIFDMDDTLITDSDATSSALQKTALYAQRQRDVDVEALQQAVYANMRRLWHDSVTHPYCEAIGISATEGLWGRFIGTDPNLQALHAWAPTYQVEVWNRSLAEQDHADHELAEQLAAFFHQERRASQALFPETEVMLQELRSNYKLGLLTNGAPDLQREKIELCHLAHYFDTIVVSGELGIGKPDPAIFSAVLNGLAVSPQTAIMVGDSLRRDILGASCCGLKPIWINREGIACDHQYAPLIHAQIANLRELYQVL